MKLTIHRGLNQIGGCIKEIATEKMKIIIDLGENLVDNKSEDDDYLKSKDEIEKLCKGVNAILCARNKGADATNRDHRGEDEHLYRKGYYHYRRGSRKTF